MGGIKEELGTFKGHKLNKYAVLYNFGLAFKKFIDGILGIFCTYTVIVDHQYRCEPMNHEELFESVKCSIFAV